MRAYIWYYRVKPEWDERFADGYGPKGEWANFFSRSPDFVRVDLLRDAHAPDRFMTIDYFANKAARSKLVDANAEEYAAIDEKWRKATHEEAFIGEFDIEECQHLNAQSRHRRRRGFIDAPNHLAFSQKRRGRACFEL